MRGHRDDNLQIELRAGAWVGRVCKAHHLKRWTVAGVNPEFLQMFYSILLYDITSEQWVAFLPVSLGRIHEVHLVVNFWFTIYDDMKRHVFNMKLCLIKKNQY